MSVDPSTLDSVASWLFASASALAAHPGRAAPLLAAVGVTAAAIAVAARLARRQIAARRHQAATRKARLITITPPPQVDPAGAGALWAHLHGLARPWLARLLHGQPHLVVEYAFTNRAATIRIWVPGTIPPGQIEHALTAAWPGATLTTDTAPDPPVPDGVPATGGLLVAAGHPALPLRVEHDTDPLRPLLDAGSATRDAETVLVQLAVRPAVGRATRPARRAPVDLAAGRPTRRRAGSIAARAATAGLTGLVRLVADLFTSARHHHRPTTRTELASRADPRRAEQLRAMLDKTGSPLWQASLRYALTVDPRGRDPKPATRRLAGRAHTIAAGFAVYTSATNSLRRVRAGRRLRAVMNQRRFAAAGVRPLLLSVSELAALAHLPVDETVPGLDRAGARPIPAPVAIPTGGRGTKPLGDAQVGGHAIALPVADSRYHLHLPGKTGAGKSTLLLHMILADAKAGRGVIVLDPGGDLVLDILDRLPASTADRVVLLDPDTGRPPRINPLAGANPYLAVDQLVGMFGAIFQRAWGPRADDVLRSACLTALLHTTKGTPTLEHVAPLLTKKEFRAPIVADIDDPAGLGGFWSWYDELAPGIRAQVAGPVLSRLRQFMARPFVRACVGNPTEHSGPDLDLGQVCDHGGILLCRLPKGQLGDDTARLLGSFVVAQIWQTITRRAATPEHLRRDCALYMDECHNFLSLPGSVDQMLAEARKFRLSMVLAHQNMAQLPRELRDAISANARNKVMFTVSPDDAHLLARHTQPVLTDHDLAHLDAYTAAARLVIGARETPAFTLKTRPPGAVLGHADTLREAWRARPIRRRRKAAADKGQQDAGN